MTNTTKEMTAGTSDQRSRAAEMARKRRIADGRDPDARTSGPFAEMMAEAGCTPEQIRRTGAAFASLAEDFALITGPKIHAEFVATFEEVAAGLDS